MTFIILLALNALFGVVVFLYFRERFMKLTKADEIKQELASVIHAFNSQADKQITILEDLVKQAGEAQKVLDHRLFEARRYGVAPAPRPETVAEAPVPTRGKAVEDLSSAAAAKPASPSRPRRASVEDGDRDKGAGVPVEGPASLQSAPSRESTPWVEKDYVLSVDEGDRAEREREERLVETLRRLEDEKFSRASLSEKVKFLHLRRGQSVREIGRRLQLSYTEIEMILQESIRE